MQAQVAITYLGWSGFRIDTDVGPLFIDPPGRTDLASDGPPFVLLSHGHPEHLSGIRDYIEQAGRAADAMVLASRAVCSHLHKSSPYSSMRFMPVQPGDKSDLSANVSVEVFEWTHLPLFPGGAMANLRHLARLASKPGLAFRIGWAGLTGPAAGPMLGFRIKFGRQQVLAYGEGLHRFCKPREVASADEPVLVLAGVEPGDEPVMPNLLRACGAEAAILYEPHATWREMFGMERANLAALRNSLSDIGIAAQIPAPQVRQVFNGGTSLG